MFQVTTLNLTPDLRTAAPNLGSCDFGELTADQFLAMMENLRLIDPVQNHEADPQIVVEAPAGKFRIRTGQGKLFLYDARDTTAASVELEPEAIVRELEQAAPVPSPEPAAAPSSAPVQSAPHHGIAITILIAGLLLNGYTLYSVFYIDDVNKKPPIELVTDPKELAGLEQSVAGHYATGNAPGDRTISIGRDGRVRFFRVLGTGERMESDDTFRIGRHDGKVCLTMPDSGVIDVNNIDSIVYYRDIYRRTK